MAILFETSPSYKSADSITGKVTLDNSRGALRHLAIQFVRVEKGDGPARERAQEVLRLDLPAAESVLSGNSVEFRWVPAGQPPTYIGKRFSVRYAIDVHAETVADESLDERAEVVLLPGPAMPTAPQPPMPWTLAPLVGGCLLLAALVLLIFSKAAFEASLAAGINALLGFIVLAPLILRRRWGVVRLSWQPQQPVLGGTIVVRVDIRRRRSWTLKRAVIHLEAEEAVDVAEPDGHGVERQPIIGLAQTLFEGPRAVAKGEKVVLEGNLEVPADAPPSFRCGAGEIVWRVRVKIDSETEAHEEVRPLVVTPKG